MVGEYGTGSGSRRIRFIRSSRPARSAATASGSCRAAFAITPIMKSVVAVDVPPAEISGSWIPVTGSRPAGLGVHGGLEDNPVRLTRWGGMG